MKDHSAAVNYAIKMGKLIKPSVCSVNSGDCIGNIEAHHWSYEEEHKLDVIWLCKKHHEELHANLNALKNKKATKNTHSRPSNSLLFYYDEKISAALELISNGNKSEAIRRAIWNEAERLTQP